MMTTKTMMMMLWALALMAGGTSAFSSTTPRSPNPVIKALAEGMKLLKPAFVAEAKLQANVLGGKVDTEAVASEVAAEVQANDIVIYTYALSPFSTEAIAMLEASGFDYEVNELGAEWFLLGPQASTKRVILSEYVAGGATSLPKVFVKGECIGGCAELASAIESGSLVEQMTEASTTKTKKGIFSFM